LWFFRLVFRIAFGIHGWRCKVRSNIPGGIPSASNRRGLHHRAGVLSLYRGSGPSHVIAENSLTGNSHLADARMATWQRCLVRLKATLASRMSVPRDEQEPIEVMLRNLRSMPLVPGPVQHDALVRLQPHVERALRVLDSLERRGDLSVHERHRLEALRELQSTLIEFK
jgi:hypothetical protein